MGLAGPGEVTRHICEHQHKLPSHPGNRNPVLIHLQCSTTAAAVAPEAKQNLLPSVPPWDLLFTSSSSTSTHSLVLLCLYFVSCPSSHLAVAVLTCFFFKKTTANLLHFQNFCLNLGNHISKRAGAAKSCVGKLGNARFKLPGPSSPAPLPVSHLLHSLMAQAHPPLSRG